MKICPLMAFKPDDKLIFRDVEITPDDCKNFAKTGALLVRTESGDNPLVDVIRGTCKESDCAWWSEERKCCGVVK